VEKDAAAWHSEEIRNFHRKENQRIPEAANHKVTRNHLNGSRMQKSLHTQVVDLPPGHWCALWECLFFFLLRYIALVS
jgi:hypothetical protein